MSYLLLELAKQNTPDARGALLLAVADNLLRGIRSRSDNELGLFEEIALHVYNTVPEHDLVQLSRRLAPHERAPQNLAMKLAEDRIEIAKPLLVHGGCFDQTHLLKLAKRINSDHLEFMAARSDIGLATSDTIVERGPASAQQVIVSNREIQLSRKALQTLIRKSVDDTVLREDLVLRSDLTPSIWQQMLPYVDNVMRNKLRETMETVRSKEQLDQVARLKRIRRDLGTTLDTSDIKTLLRDTHNEGIEFNDLVTLLLQDNRLPHVIELLSRQIRRPFKDVRDVVFNGAINKVVEFAHEADLRPDTFVLFANARSRHFKLSNAQANEWIQAYDPLESQKTDVSSKALKPPSGDFAANRNNKRRPFRPEKIAGRSKRLAAM